MIKRILTLFCILVITYSFTSCNAVSPADHNKQESPPFISKTDFLLNTVVTINLYDKQEESILDECFDLIAKYETIYSRTSETSELYSINYRNAPHNGPTYKISDEISDILISGLYYSKLSGGAFDISVAPITSLWDFQSSDPKLPDQNKLKNALTLVNYENIKLNKNDLSFAVEGMGIDLGAIAKGYIADRVKELLIKKGVKSAMINLGGNVLCVGEKPDGTPFRVGIQKPYADRNVTVATMDIRDMSVVSSGVYERYFILDGVHYHHILDPHTGYPYINDLTSVTIISKYSTDGDGLSTTCFALGLDKGLKLIESLPDTYAVFITSDYEIHYSEGFQEAITVTQQ